MKRLFTGFLFGALLLHGNDLTLSAGVQFTPDRTALNHAGTQAQRSRIGPSGGISYRHWITSHQGISVESTLGNTDTRLEDGKRNVWTMNRVSVDGVYTYRFGVRRFRPYVKAGLGTMVLISGQAPGGPVVGLDTRMEELTGVGVEYRLSHSFSVSTEYEARFFRNPDFTDHAWHPERNVISEPRIGVTYTFGR